jgi:hypothetical protein
LVSDSVPVGFGLLCNRTNIPHKDLLDLLISMLQLAPFDIQPIPTTIDPILQLTVDNPRSFEDLTRRFTVRSQTRDELRRLRREARSLPQGLQLLRLLAFSSPQDFAHLALEVTERRQPTKPPEIWSDQIE